MTAALVTGANGFVGRHVARDLARNGHVVKGVGHGTWLREEWSRWGISEWHTADVSIETLLTYAGEPAMIVHCAGSGAVGFSMTHPAQDFKRSVDTTLAVLEFIRTHTPKTALVMPSSAGVYGVAQALPITVASELRPVSPYGLHKQIAEDLCRSYGRHFGVCSAIVRLFSIYGVGLRKQLLWDACAKLAAGAAEFAGTGEETRDWLHVDDAASLLRHAAAHASRESPVVNGGTGRSTTIAHVVDTIADRLDVAVKPRFSGQRRAGDPTDYLADISEALSCGWRPTRNLDAEIAAYVKWFKQGAP